MVLIVYGRVQTRKPLCVYMVVTLVISACGFNKLVQKGKIGRKQTGLNKYRKSNFAEADVDPFMTHVFLLVKLIIRQCFEAFGFQQIKYCRTSQKLKF